MPTIHGFEITIADLPFPLPENADVPELSAIGQAAEATLRGLQHLNQHLLGLLVAEAYSQSEDVDLEEWADAAHRRLVVPLFELTVYEGNDWAATLEAYAEHLAAAAELLPRYDTVARLFDRLSAERSDIEEATRSLANDAVEHIEQDPHGADMGGSRAH